MSSYNDSGLTGAQRMERNRAIVWEADRNRRESLRLSTLAGPATRGGISSTSMKTSTYDAYGKKLFAKEGMMRYDLFTGENTPSQPLDKLTFGQVIALQKKRKINTAAGAYQFTLGTLQDTMRDAGFKETDIFDSRNQYKLFETFTRKNEEHAMKVLGKSRLSDAERYSLHFLGRYGGTKFLKMMKENPSANFSREFNAAFSNNRALVDRVGGPRASVSDVFKEFSQRMK